MAAREAWLDRLRGVASIGMIVVHVTHAVLREDVRDTPIFRGVEIAFGLVAPAFLFCVGASFALGAGGARVVTSADTSADTRRRLARAAGLFVLGYAMHVSGLLAFARSHDLADLRVFTQADILQVIAIALALLAAMAWASARWFVAALVLGGVALVAAPFTQSLHEGALPAFALTYLSHAVPSQFPLFPWLAHALLAAGLAIVLPRTWPRAWPFVLAGLALGAATIAFFATPLFPPHDPWRAGPAYALLRLAIVAGTGGALGRMRMPKALDDVLSLFGRRSLFLYVVHVALVYGRHPLSLRSRVGATLGVVPTAAWCVFVLVAAWALASLWDRKSRRIA